VTLVTGRTAAIWGLMNGETVNVTCDGLEEADGMILRIAGGSASDVN